MNYDVKALGVYFNLFSKEKNFSPSGKNYVPDPKVLYA